MWTQPDFARAIGITRDRLVNIESCRTPLNYVLALNICRTFDIRPGWLASGKLPMQPYRQIIWNAEERAKFSEKDLLTKVFDITPGDFPTVLERKNEPPIMPPGFSFQKEIFSTVRYVCESTKFKDETSAWQFAVEVERFIEKKLREYRSNGKAIRPNTIESLLQSFNYRKIMSEVMLDKGGPQNDSAIVSDITSLADLIKELQKLTKVRGMKAELAKECKVSRQAVNQWLSEDSRPSAEAVFAALKWVIGKRTHKQK